MRKETINVLKEQLKKLQPKINNINNELKDTKNEMNELMKEIKVLSNRKAHIIKDLHDAKVNTVSILKKLAESTCSDDVGKKLIEKDLPKELVYALKRRHWECEGCGNTWDIKNLPVCDDFTGYDEILLTGGEPMLRPNLTGRIADTVRVMNMEAMYYMYTAKVDDYKAINNIMAYLDGLTVTLHEQSDVEPFIKFNKYMYKRNDWYRNGLLSLRLNVFRDVDIYKCNVDLWTVKDNIEWIKNCPLPEGEVMMRLG